MAAMPDSSAVGVYLEALGDRDPAARRLAFKALQTIRKAAEPALGKALTSGSIDESTRIEIEKILADFTPIAKWRVIGPFARTTARVFVGEPAIDFNKKHSGVEGTTIAWQARTSERRDGAIVIEDLKKGKPTVGQFGYDMNSNPDMCTFAYAEVESGAAQQILLRVGSSGSMLVTVNEQTVYSYDNFAGRAYAPDSDYCLAPLKKGVNRILVKSRQGVGSWCFSVQCSTPLHAGSSAGKPRFTIAQLAEFALGHKGDLKRGEEIFFDERGVGCVKCHSVAGKGKATIGPDLAGLALKYDSAEIVRSVLEPSNRIATGYQPVVLATTDGRVLTGLVRSETDQAIELVDADAKTTVVSKKEIEERKISQTSIMPVGIADRLSPVEFADLVEYLKSLKTAPKAGANLTNESR